MSLRASENLGCPLSKGLAGPGASLWDLMTLWHPNGTAKMAAIARKQCISCDLILSKCKGFSTGP